MLHCPFLGTILIHGCDHPECCCRDHFPSWWLRLPFSDSPTRGAPSLSFIEVANVHCSSPQPVNPHPSHHCHSTAGYWYPSLIDVGSSLNFWISKLVSSSFLPQTHVQDGEEEIPTNVSKTGSFSLPDPCFKLSFSVMAGKSTQQRLDC